MPEAELIVSDDASLAELVEREQRIERAQRNAYYEIGLDLKEIRDRQLYKAKREESVAGRYSFTTFEEYVSERWDMSEEHARRLIQSADVASKLHQLVEFSPTRESHVREPKSATFVTVSPKWRNSQQPRYGSPRPDVKSCVSVAPRGSCGGLCVRVVASGDCGGVRRQSS